MTQKELGNLGMIKVASRYIELGYTVFSEMGDNSDIDLIVIKDKELLKIQVKTTSRIKNGKMEWRICKSRLNTKEHRYVFYDNKIDGYALCCLENAYIGYIPLSECSNKYTVTLRIENPKNNQKSGILKSEYYKI